MNKPIVRSDRQLPGNHFAELVQAKQLSEVPDSSTDVSKVRREIASDTAHGKGAMTAREAGHMKSRR